MAVVVPTVAAQTPPATDEVQPIASLSRGEYAVVRGTVVRFLDEDEILLADETGIVLDGDR